jgi:tetratricopeptide (TPR) repeat protein
MVRVRKLISSIAAPVPVGGRRMKELKALREGERTASQWAEMASGYLAAGEPEKAREAAGRAVSTGGGCARGHAILGFIAFRADKDVDAARKHFLAAKKLDADYFNARLYLGVLAEKKGLADEAIEELEAARKLYPRFSRGPLSPYLLLAGLYEKAGKTDKAVEVLRDCVRIDDANLKALVRLGELLAKQKKPAEAVEAYLGAVFIDPYDAKIHTSLAEAYEAAGDKAAAGRERGIAKLLKE